jgi:hypothetical protein
MAQAALPAAYGLCAQAIRLIISSHLIPVEIAVQAEIRIPGLMVAEMVTERM